jgi:two-component system, chemotaxis family, protein-glutamate methylesterase/glutaminase
VPVRLLTVDDSPFFLDVLAGIVAHETDIVVVGAARDGIEAVRQIIALSPDLITLDVEMPGLDGLATLERIMAVKPTPVIMISSHTRASSAATVRALQLGAADFITKPERALRESYEALRAQVLEKVRAVAARAPAAPAARAARAVLPLPTRPSRIIVLGSSTGGAAALTRILNRVPRRPSPTIVAVQHMPGVFTRELAASFSRTLACPVGVAGNEQIVEPGRIYVVPGGCHATVFGDTFRLTRGEPVNGHRPSVDVTMSSIARRYGPEACGVLLTGIGGDGARGIADIKDGGGFTMVQDEATSVVFGMPKAAIATGKVDAVLSLDDIADCVAVMCGK